LRFEGLGEVVDDVLSVLGDAEEAARAPGVLPREADEDEAFDGGDSALMIGVTLGVEDVEVEEVEVGLEADAPEDTGDVFFDEVEGGGFGLGVPAGLVGRFFGGGDLIPGNVVVDHLPDAEVGSVGGVEFFGGVGADSEAL